MTMHTACLGLGSNLNDPVNQIKKALSTIKNTPEMSVISISSLYQTPPVGPVQPDFINCVIMLKTSLSAHALLKWGLTLEEMHQRVRLERWGPRTLDVDVLFYDECIIKTEALTLPHPELENRPFWLIPLAEIAPKWILPNGEQVSHYVKKWNTAGITPC